MTSGFTRFHEIEKTLKIQAFLILGNSRFHAKKTKFEIIRGFFVDFFSGGFSGFYQGSKRRALLREGINERMYSMFARPCCDRDGGRSPVCLYLR